MWQKNPMPSKISSILKTSWFSWELLRIWSESAQKTKAEYFKVEFDSLLVPIRQFIRSEPYSRSEHTALLPSFFSVERRFVVYYEPEWRIFYWKTSKVKAVFIHKMVAKKSNKNWDHFFAANKSNTWQINPRQINPTPLYL